MAWIATGRNWSETSDGPDWDCEVGLVQALEELIAHQQWDKAREALRRVEETFSRGAEYRARIDRGDT